MAGRSIRAPASVAIPDQVCDFVDHGITNFKPDRARLCRLFMQLTEGLITDEKGSIELTPFDPTFRSRNLIPIGLCP